MGNTGIGIPRLVALASLYEVTTERCRQRTGLIARNTSELELADIRNIQVKQGLVARAFFVGDVLISSAGQSGMEVVFSGVLRPHDVAGRIREARKAST